MADIFINKTEFYERIGPILSEIKTELSWAASPISREANKPYCHKEIKSGLGVALRGLEKAEALLKEIHIALQEVKYSDRKVAVNRDEKRIMRLSVIKGGEPIKKGRKG